MTEGLPGRRPMDGFGVAGNVFRDLCLTLRGRVPVIHNGILSIGADFDAPITKHGIRRRKRSWRVP